MKDDFVVKSADKEFHLNFDQTQKGKGSVNKKSFDLNIVDTATGIHVLKDGKGYNVDVIEVDAKKKTVVLRINHKRYVLEVKDQYDLLLDQLGMTAVENGKVSEIKAPMPGLVLDILVSEGETVKTDQPLLILEAMKMENVIKSPGDGLVKKIEVNKKDSVEKNQLLIAFD